MNEDNGDKQQLVTINTRHNDWVNNRWRPMMGWVYMATCVFDFIIAPIAWPILFAGLGLPVVPWLPITLQGAGLYHMSMGAILGVTAWTKGQEKISSMNLSMNYADPELAARKEAAAKRKAKHNPDAPIPD
jgi:hypothetical protein